MLSLFPRDVLDEIWDLIGSVSEGFPTYLFIGQKCSIVQGSKQEFIRVVSLINFSPRDFGQKSPALLAVIALNCCSND